MKDRATITAVKTTALVSRVRVSRKCRRHSRE